MLIVLGGLPGVGKTSIARELATLLGAVHIRIDSIERAVRESGVTVVSLDDAGYRVGYAVAEDNLLVGRIVIADSVNPLAVTRDSWIEVATRVGVPGVEVEIVCSDGDEHRRRVEQRIADTPGSSGLSWQEIISRDYRSWDRERLVIDTARCSVGQSVAMLQAALPLS